MFITAMAATGISIYQTSLTRDALSVSLKSNLQAQIIDSCEASLSSLSVLSLSYRNNETNIEKENYFLHMNESMEANGLNESGGDEINAQEFDDESMKELSDRLAEEFNSENWRVFVNASKDLAVLEIYSSEKAIINISNLKNDMLKLSLVVVASQAIKKGSLGTGVNRSSDLAGFIAKVESGIDIVKSKCREVMIGNNTGLL